MTGHTLIMSPPGDNTSTSTVPRSYSASQLLDGPSEHSSAQRQASKHQRALSEKTLPTLPTFDIPTFGGDFELDTSIFLKGKTPPVDQPTPAVPEIDDGPARLPFARVRASTIADRPRSWFLSAKPSMSFSRDTESPRPYTSQDIGPSTTSITEKEQLPTLERSMTSSDSFASFAKRSWKTSRSSSPKPQAQPKPSNALPTPSDLDEDKTPTKQVKTKKRPHLIDLHSLPRPSIDASRTTTPKAFAKASSYFTKLKPKQNLFTTSGTDSDTSSATSYADTPSTTTETRTSESTCEEGEGGTTDENGSGKPVSEQDPLWSSFKSLEIEFKGFATRPMNQRITQVQEALMPFLCRTSPDETIKKLSAENVDRRACVLNKWWSGILDMLDGKGQQPVPGVDRSFLLETVVMIMMRMEWRQTTTCFLPLADRSPRERVRSRAFTQSTDSTKNSSQAAFLLESAEHNVKTMFVANLVKQMGIVVEKLSLRHAPTSLVNFAGKTCAYAFFFAPGVADVLIRLWSLLPDQIKRSGEAYNLPRRSKGESDDIIALFPEHLAAFGWTSHRTLWDALKRVPRMPLMVARIPWTGPWVSRWKGRDTDLFFIFCKYFHVLADQFMPEGIPLVEQSRAPAFVLLGAQILSVLDSTIHRQAALQHAQQLPLMDSENGADAALTMTLPTSNMMKAMSDNTLVVLLRNVLSDDASDIAGAKQTFADSFQRLFKAAVRRTSRYDNASCFSLCEFLEEVLSLYSEYEGELIPSAQIDWHFWVDVLKKMLGSFNTMSEVRLLSFVFTMWDVLAKRPEQKAALCRDWLLTTETFEAFFNHWCPMVRAYYQRLLCWRICRDGGKANEVDADIFLTVSARLKTTWAHYLYLKHDAALGGRLSPSTAPTLPTPGKKFIIIRQEINSPQPGLFMGFDNFAKLPANNTTTLDAVTAEDDEKAEGKKRWSLIGKMLGFGNGDSGEKSHTDEQSTRDKDLQAARQETAEARTRPSTPPQPPPKTSQDQDSACSTPVYEDPKHVFRFILGWQQPPGPPRDRMLTRPRLPGPAQARVSSRSLGGSPQSHRASKPALTRACSGSPALGLVTNAKNVANTPGSPESGLQRPNTNFKRTLSSDSGKASHTSEDTAFLITDERENEDEEAARMHQGLLMEPMTKPVKPAGIYTKNAVYCGRALAEWSLVVFECNNFVDRRREEGVLGLSEVEVPTLGVEGFRKVGG